MIAQFVTTVLEVTVGRAISNYTWKRITRRNPSCVTSVNINPPLNDPWKNTCKDMKTLKDFFVMAVIIRQIITQISWLTKGQSMAKQWVVTIVTLPQSLTEPWGTTSPSTQHPWSAVSVTSGPTLWQHWGTTKHQKFMEQKLKMHYNHTINISRKNMR